MRIHFTNLEEIYSQRSDPRVSELSLKRTSQPLLTLPGLNQDRCVHLLAVFPLESRPEWADGWWQGGGQVGGAEGWWGWGRGRFLLPLEDRSRRKAPT